LPDLGRRLCDAALRRRRSGLDGDFHREPVLDRLQLAARQRHGVHHRRRDAGDRACRRPASQAGTHPMSPLNLSHGLWAIFALAVSFYLVAPLALVILFSFNSSALTSLPLTGLTIDWYRKLMALDYFWPALQNSLIVALAVGTLSVIIGTLAALAVARLSKGRAGEGLGTNRLPSVEEGTFNTSTTHHTIVRRLQPTLSEIAALLR